MVRSSKNSPHLLKRYAAAALIGAALAATWNGFTLGPVQLVDALLLVSICCLLLSGGSFQSVPVWILVPASAVALVAVVGSSMPMPDHYFAQRYQLAAVEVSLTVGAKWLVAILVLPWLAVNLREWADTFRLLAAFAMGAAISGGVAVLDFVGATNVSAQLTGENVAGRLSGLASHVNNLGFSCAIALPIGVMVFRRRPYVGVLTSALLASGVVLSGSRGAQVGAVLGIVALIAFDAGSRRRLVKLAYLFAWILSLVWLLRLDLVSAIGISELLRFDDDTATASDEGRLALLSQALNDFRASPIFGVGLGVLSHAHSIFFQLLAAGGLILFLAMAYFWVNLVVACRRLIGTWPLAPFALASVVTWLAVGLVENQLTDRYLYFTCAAVCMALPHGAKQGINSNPGKDSMRDVPATSF